MSSLKKQTGFTIVELLVVIVVIGILAAITIVSYTGISQKAVASSLQSDLDNASKQLKLYYVDNGAYPASLNSNCPVGPSDTRYCLKSSSGNTFTYAAPNPSPQSFTLVAANNTTSYRVTNNTAPAAYNVTPGAILELHAAKAVNGLSPGINSPLTTTWTDTSGNGNNGTLTNFGVQTPWGGTGATGDPYKLTFDGGDDRVALPDIGAGEGITFSYEAWFKTLSNPSSATIISERSTANNNAYAMLRMVTGGVLQFVGRDDVMTNAVGFNAHAGKNDGQWHHVVVTFGSSTVRIYCDGAEFGSSAAWTPGARSLVASSLGASISTTIDQFFPGAIPVVRIYPFTLSTTQITQNYVAGPTW